MPASERTGSVEFGVQESGVAARLQAVSAAGRGVVWASGVNGTYCRTTDGGASWSCGMVSGGEALEFRDVHAVDSLTAYLLSAGPGEASRIYHTSDGGNSWELQFVNDEPAAFFDCMAFWDEASGVALSDPVGGRFLIITTVDGTHWEPVPPENVPGALQGEAGFAASGTCIAAQGESAAWFATGGGDSARVFHTEDRGRTWSVHSTPLAAGAASSGIMTLAFRDTQHGIVAGGDYRQSDAYGDNVAVTDNGGVTWQIVGRPTFPGAVFGVALVPGSPGTVVAVGPQGAAYSLDWGASWEALDSAAYWSVGFDSAASGWLVGPGGRIARVRFGSKSP